MDLLINGKRVRLHPILVSDNGKPWQVIEEPTKKDGANADPDFWSFHDQESACDIIEMIETVFGKQSVDKEGKEAFDVWLAIGKTMDLFDSKVLDAIVCKGELEEIRWKNRYTSDPLNVENSKKDLWPTILLMEDDVLGVVQKTKEAEAIIEKCEEQFDPRYQFFDSSIWYRMISLEGDDFKGRFEKLLEELVQHNEKRLYNTISAIESLELQQRLFLNSYLVDEVDGHSQAVVPFRFHSETMMKVRAKEIEAEISPYTWGCVLIDDFAYTPMKCKNKCPDAISKRKLIHKIVNQQESDSTGDVIIEEDELLMILNNGDPAPPDENENWTRKGKELIKKYPYADLLIVDYLLGKDEKDQLQFGADLINNIMEEDDLKDAKPFKKHWIFPIAVFNNAFASHLGEVGENNIQSKLTLAKGADPVTTPHLFKYQLFTFLKAQKVSLELTLPAVLKQIVEESEKRNHRGVLADAYENILESVTNLKLLESAKKGGVGSRFARSYLGSLDENGELRRLSIHIQNLAHFIGFGSVQDTGKIRKELWRLNDSLNRLSPENQGLNPLKEYGLKWIRSIETYVEELSAKS